MKQSQDKYVIVGAGALGRSLYSLLCDVRGDDSCIAGFIDDDLSALDAYAYPKKILSTISAYQPDPSHQLLLAMAAPAAKRAVVQRLSAQGACFATFIHPSAHVGLNVTLGEGCVVFPGAMINVEAVLGDFVMLGFNVQVGHDACVGSFTSASPLVAISGHSKVGVGCLFGAQSVVISGTKLGDNVLVGAGAVVIKDVGDNDKVVGNPARSILNVKSAEACQS